MTAIEQKLEPLRQKSAFSGAQVSPASELNLKKKKFVGQSLSPAEEKEQVQDRDSFDDVNGMNGRHEPEERESKEEINVNKKPKKRITWKDTVEVDEYQRYDMLQNCQSSEDLGASVASGVEEFNPKKMFEALDQDQETEDEYYKNLYKTEETDEQFYERILMDWEDQDRLNNDANSYFFQMFVYPMMFMMQVTQWVVRILMTVVNTVMEPPSRTDQGFLGSVYWTMQHFNSLEDVPVEHKKESAMVFFFLMMVTLIVFSYFAAIFFILFPLTTVPMLVYCVFIYFDSSPEDGSRVAFMRYWKMWRHFVRYFPIRLVKTSNLDPSEKYVMSYHPHGIISFGAFGNFATDATGFSRLFPGINLRVITLSQSFYTPWVREILLSMGLCSSSKRSCCNNLQRGPGSAILLVVGGADESLLAAPGTYRLNVNGRKGFVRVALENGAHLVPVLGFGENDVYTICTFESGSTFRSIQDRLKKMFGFATPIFWGRDSNAHGEYGFMPHRTPIIAVVGKPVKCPFVPKHLLVENRLRTTAEGREIVSKFHEEYIKALKALYNAFKDKWAINRSESMVFVGRKASILSDASKRTA